MSIQPTVTVVVCTRNRADQLPIAIGSLARLSAEHFNYEVLVINNGSTDDTDGVIERLAAGFPVPLRCVREERPGVGVARNRGIAEAAGEWIAFFDDDQIADPNWLTELLALAIRKDCRCVGGRVRLRLPEGVNRPLSPVCQMLLGCSVNMETELAYTPTRTPGAGNLMVHRSVFAQIGGFDETLIRGEDTDLFLRMHAAGVAGWYSPDAIIDHLIPPERLSDTFLLGLAGRMADGMAADEYFSRRSAVYPLVWLARVGQAAGVLMPRFVWAKLRGNAEAALGARCRLEIARLVLRDGLGLLRGGAKTAASPTRAVPVPAR